MFKPLLASAAAAFLAVSGPAWATCPVRPASMLTAVHAGAVEVSDHWTERSWGAGNFGQGATRGSDAWDLPLRSGSRTFGYEYRSAPYYGYYPHRPRVVAPTPVEPRVHYGSPEPWTARWYVYCADRYRSFDRRTGYFRTFGGERRFCR